jgi:hypothetical protein
MPTILQTMYVNRQHTVDRHPFDRADSLRTLLGTLMFSLNVHKSWYIQPRTGTCRFEWGIHPAGWRSNFFLWSRIWLHFWIVYLRQWILPKYHFATRDTSPNACSLRLLPSDILLGDPANEELRNITKRWYATLRDAQNIRLTDDSLLVATCTTSNSNICRVCGTVVGP